MSALPDPAARAARLVTRLAALRTHPHASRGFAAHGVLRRMAGMTLEAEGCEAPVGSRCVVVDNDGSTTETEVVGFSGGSLLLVATDEIGDVTPGARVIPGGKVFEAFAGPGLLGRVLDGAGQPLDGLGPAALRGSHSLDAAAAESARPQADSRAARCRRAFDQRTLDRRPRSTARTIRRQRRRQERPARHDDALHDGRRHRRRPDRRARPRGAGLRVAVSDPADTQARRHHRDAGGPTAARAHSQRAARDEHRRIFPRPGQERAAAHGFADARVAGAARDRAGDR